MSRFLFIDDSGSKQWGVSFAEELVRCAPARTPENRNFWQGNYFVLAGVYVDSEAIAELNCLINRTKERYFGTRGVEIYSVDLRNPYRLHKKYLRPYGISANELKEFVDEFWYPLFAQYDLKLMAIVVDKHYFCDAQRRETPLEIAARVLFDQIEKHSCRECRVVFDQMDSQLRSYKNDQGKIFRIVNTEIELDGEKCARKYSRISVVFDRSCNSNFLQLADMVAYNTWRQFVDYGYGGRVDAIGIDGHGKISMYKYFARIVDGFWGDGDVAGDVGIIKLPKEFDNGG